MDRTEFKQRISTLIDNLVPDGELSEDSEGILIDNFGEVAQETLDEDETGSEEENAN